jgi:microsomal epoxide hydrolase
MRQLAAYWRDGYDWRRAEAELNSFAQYRVAIDGFDIHFVYEPGSGDHPLPLLITHGWPGSVYEFYGIIEQLAHPERFGGKVEDAFTVVAPSLPGYGFSTAPAQPVNPRQVAPLWHKLMRDIVGADRFVAQAGDWGSVVTSWLAVDFPEAVAAIHLNMLALRPYLGAGTPPLDDAEKRWIAATKQRLAAEGGYQAIQGTKPQSLAYGLTDSPIGLAAWIVEKFHGWPGAKPDQPPPFSMDQLLTNIMLYWLNGINAPNWMYWSVRHDGGISLAKDQRVEVPTGFAFFAYDLFPVAPENWVKRAYNVAYRRDFAFGGHFAALENGPILVEEMRQFFRAYRG